MNDGTSRKLGIVTLDLVWVIPTTPARAAGVDQPANPATYQPYLDGRKIAAAVASPPTGPARWGAGA